MRVINQKFYKRITMLAVALAIVGVLASSASAQKRQKPLSLDPDQQSTDDPDRGMTTFEEEMRAKRAIRAAEKEYQENLDRARDLSVLGASIVTSFKEKSVLNREDLKKLEKVEKLAKGIRSAAGGSEDDFELEKPPQDLPSAVDMLGDLSKSLKDKVEKTPKHVISAAVIDEANVLLQVIRIVKTLPSKA